MCRARFGAHIFLQKDLSDHQQLSHFDTLNDSRVGAKPHSIAFDGDYGMPEGAAAHRIPTRFHNR